MKLLKTFLAVMCCQILLASCSYFTKSAYQSGVTHQTYVFHESSEKTVLKLDGKYYLQGEIHQARRSYRTGMSPESSYTIIPDTRGQDVVCLLDLSDKHKEMEETGVLTAVRILSATNASSIDLRKAKPVARLKVKRNGNYDNSYHVSYESQRTALGYLSLPFVMPVAFALDLAMSAVILVT